MRIRESDRNAHIGAAWLDVRYPGWANKIDVQRLNMMSCDDCIGGQLGVNWVHLRAEFMRDNDHLPDNLFASDQEGWVREIEQRQLKPAPVRIPEPVSA